MFTKYRGLPWLDRVGWAVIALYVALALVADAAMLADWFA